jgi:hypothetical protein
MSDRFQYRELSCSWEDTKSGQRFENDEPWKALNVLAEEMEQQRNSGALTDSINRMFEECKARRYDWQFYFPTPKEDGLPEGPQTFPEGIPFETPGQERAFRDFFIQHSQRRGMIVRFDEDGWPHVLWEEPGRLREEPK